MVNSKKIIESIKWFRMIESDQAKACVQKVSKSRVSPPDFQWTPRVREFRSSTPGGLNQAPFMVDTRMVFDSAHLQLAKDSYTYSPNTHEEKICLGFIEFDEMTQVSKGKMSIKVEHPIVSIIGNYTINAVNGAFEQSVTTTPPDITTGIGVTHLRVEEYKESDDEKMKDIYEDEWMNDEDNHDE